MSEMRAAAPAAPFACREVVEILTAYAEGVLDADTTTRVRWHLALCPGCEIYLRQLTVTARTLAALSLEPLPEQTTSGLVRVYRDWVASSRERR
jgi:anti-sigma factor RsiW